MNALRKVQFDEVARALSLPLNRQIVGRASRLPSGRPALEISTAGGTPGAAGETSAPLLNTDDPLTGPPAPRHQPLTTDYHLLITGHATTGHSASGFNPRQFLERVKYPQLSLLGSSRLRGGSSSIDTGHCFHTSSQFGFRFSRRSRTMSSSASKLASNRSPGAAGASAAGMLTRRLASSVTIMVGTSHFGRKLSILRRGDECCPSVAEYSTTDHRLLTPDYCLLITGHRSPSGDYRLLITDYSVTPPQATRPLPPATQNNLPGAA